MSPHLQWFVRVQQRCFTVQLQKCFADYETLPDISIGMRVFNV